MLSVAEVKNHLRIDVSDDDALIGVLIDVVTSRLEDHTDRKFITQGWDIYFQSFSYPKRDAPWWDGTREGSISSLYDWVSELVLPFGPVQQNDPVDFFVRTYTEDGVPTVYDPINYTVDTIGPHGRIVLKTGSMWPQDILRRTNGIKISAVFGYGDTAAEVPAPIKQACLLTVAKLYENRGDDAGGEAFQIPNTALMLLEPYKHFKVGVG